jgi:hypothetical protein
MPDTIVPAQLVQDKFLLSDILRYGVDHTISTLVAGLIVHIPSLLLDSLYAEFQNRIFHFETFEVEDNVRLLLLVDHHMILGVVSV